MPDKSPQCPNCGQRFGGSRRTFTATTTSFRALEKRRARAARAAEDLPFTVGEIVNGRYEIRDLIGKGPLGVVYRVHDQEIELDVALKVLHPHIVPDSAAQGRFTDAIRRMRKLSQQNIVRLYEHDAVKDRVFFTMQLLEGLPLRKVMGLRREKEQRFSVREVEPIFNQITMALGHAHRHTAHGGLKPENILILPDVLKLTDFGGFDAVPRDTFVEAQTTAKRDQYLAPELIAGEEVGPPADIYSLGALLYELLTGQPFSRDAAPISKLLDQPDEARPGGIDRLVSRATAKAPGARYESAEAFSEALGTYIDARELVSVDIRAGMILPEDITRKFKAPKALQDDDEPDGPEVMVGRSLTDDAAPTDMVSVAAATAGLPELPVASAEESFVEALDSTDLESMVESSESVDIAVVPPLPAAGVAAAGVAAAGVAAGAGAEPFGARLPEPPPPERLPEPPPPEPEAEHTLPLTDTTAAAASGPWFLRSNVGFVLSIMLVVGVASFIVLRMLDDDDPPEPTSPEVVRVEGSKPAESAPETVNAQPITVAAQPASVAVVSASPGTEAIAPGTQAPATAQSGAPVSVAAAALKSTAPATPKTAAPKTAAPATRKTAPKTAAPAAPKTAAPKTAAPATPKTAAPKTAAPKTAAPAAPKTAAPKTAAPAAPKTAAPKTDAPKAAAGDGETLKCPAGQIMIRTARFPKGTVKKGRITGAGVALAKSGKAYCIDAYEYPGRGRRPRTSVTHTAAAGACKAAGKRLCTDREWLRACVGRGGASYPYGRTFDGNKCNTEDAEGDERSLAAAGSFRRCRSAVGAFDMSGNAAEWTADQTVRGGNYASADEDAACRAGGRRSAGSARASIGFRCCSDFKP